MCLTARDISLLDHPRQPARSPFCEQGDFITASHAGLSGCGQLHPPLFYRHPCHANPLPSLPRPPVPGPRVRPLCSCPRKVGREGDREQDGDLSRGCQENALLPGRVLKRKKGSKAASPAQWFIPGRTWGPGQSQTLPQRQEHKQRRLLRLRKCRDGKFQGLGSRSSSPQARSRANPGGEETGRSEWFPESGASGGTCLFALM